MLKGRTIIQHGYAVKDIDKAIDFWSETLNVGPFFIAEFTQQPYLSYRGQPSRLEGRIAISYMGDLQIELVEQSNDSPSIYREFLLSRGEGLHHIKLDSQDFSADVDQMLALGYEKAFWGDIPYLASFAYFDAVDRYGHFIELSKVTPDHERKFAELKAICNAWDGQQPRQALS